MTRRDLEEALERHSPTSGDDLVLVLKGPAIRWRIIRPELLDSWEDGTRLYGIRKWQAEKLLREWEERDARPVDCDEEPVR